MLCSGQSFAMPARAAIVEEEAGLRLYEEVGACVASVHIRLADGEGARLGVAAHAQGEVNKAMTCGASQCNATTHGKLPAVAHVGAQCQGTSCMQHGSALATPGRRARTLAMTPPWLVAVHSRP